MEIPNNSELPFFAYGLFRPDQLGYHRVRELVTRCDAAEHRGDLRVRDGLPILDPTGSGRVPGFVLQFTSPEAYARIVEIEPDKQYIWAETEVSGRRANVLFGRSPQRGSELAEDEWDGARDPLFTSALRVVRDMCSENEQFNWDLTPMFRLQMAYLLLWSAIERFVSLKYNLGGAVWEKVQHLADEPAFAQKLAELNPPERAVFRADDPQKKAVLRLDPKKAVEHYYQIRSNITHRGKGVVRDHDRVLHALRELIELFEAVLRSNFGDRWRSAG